MCSNCLIGYLTSTIAPQRLFLLLLLAGALAACGVYSNPVPAPENNRTSGSTPTPVGTASREATSSSAAGQLTARPDDVRLAATIDALTPSATRVPATSPPGKTFSRQCSPDYPGDPIDAVTVPEYPAAQLVRTEYQSAYRFTKLYTTDAEPQAVMDFYRAELPKHGWKQQAVGTGPPDLLFSQVIYDQVGCSDSFVFDAEISSSEGGLTSVRVNVYVHRKR